MHLFSQSSQIVPKK